MSIKILGISGSLRQQSCNSGLLRSAARHIASGSTFDTAILTDIPFYHADFKEKPESVKRVLAQMAIADAFVFACPEYNYSIAPALKNILDWASREPDNALLSDKSVALMGAGGGMGTSRAQYHLRQVCVFLNLHPVNKPEVFANAFNGSFDSDGNVVDEKIDQLLATQMRELLSWTVRLKQK